MFSVFSFGTISLLMITGLLFVFKGIQKKMNNLYFLAASFLSVALGFLLNFGLRSIFRIDPGIGNIVQEYFIFAGFLTFVYFTNITFYRNNMKTGNIVLILVILLGLFQLILINVFGPNVEIERGFEYYLRVSFDLPYTFLTFNWLAYSCYVAYMRLKDTDVEPWIKARYKLVAISSFILSFHSIPEFFQPKYVRWGSPGNPISLIVFGITTSLMMVYVLMVSISWFMPKCLKDHFNKGHIKEIEKDYSEEELDEILVNELGNKK